MAIKKGYNPPQLTGACHDKKKTGDALCLRNANVAMMGRSCGHTTSGQGQVDCQRDRGTPYCVDIGTRTCRTGLDPGSSDGATCGARRKAVFSAVSSVRENSVCARNESLILCFFPPLPRSIGLAK